MYSVRSIKKSFRKRDLQGGNFTALDGFSMASKRKVFHISGENIRNIQVMDIKLAHPLVMEKVIVKYNRLIALLTDLLVDDDDSGDSYREALNQIEKFRLEIKNKYRDFLKKKELEMMSKQLMRLKKEASLRLMEIQDYYMEMQNEAKHSR